MPHRRPPWSLLFGVATAMVVASPFAALSLGTKPSVHPVDNFDPLSTSTQVASVLLSAVPDIVLPLHQLTGLNLPDLRLSDLKKLPLPQYLPIPDGLPVPPGMQLPSVLELPKSGGLGNTAAPSIPGLDQLPKGAVDQLGATVKQLTRKAPFSMVALTAKDLHGTAAKIRALQPDGSWGPWQTTDPVDTADATSGDQVAGTEPVYVGQTNTVQVLMTRDDMPTTGSAENLRRPAPGLLAPKHGGKLRVPETPANPPAPAATIGAGATQVTDLAESLVKAAADGLSAVLIDPTVPATTPTLDNTPRASTLPIGGPMTLTRASWGADEKLRCANPVYDSALNGITVHHTGGRNDYTREQSAEIVRGIYAYHTKTLHWCDIGYNVLIDKYGQIFEGRAGGLDKVVEGAHAGGFNVGTAGVALLGNYSVQQPSPMAVEAMGKFIGWRLKTAQLDPRGKVTLYSAGGPQYTAFRKGAAVTLPVIFGHRDVGKTECPGNALYAQLPRIREIAARVAGRQ